jgi:hypothetical protein
MATSSRQYWNAHLAFLDDLYRRRRPRRFKSAFRIRSQSKPGRPPALAFWLLKRHSA